MTDAGIKAQNDFIGAVGHPLHIAVSNRLRLLRG